ncbi:MAG: hypothetical protein ABSA11_17120 [Candidatus Bathyarchaeia archaeon]
MYTPIRIIPKRSREAIRRQPRPSSFVVAVGSCARYVAVESTVAERPTLSPSYLTQVTPILFGATWVTILALLLTQLI